jgi:ribosomal protein S18 acetylase RimI-like enzyme
MLDIRPLARRDLRAATEILATSFAADPMIVTMMPNAALRSRALPHALRGQLIESMAAGGAHGAWDGEQLVGVAVTRPFGTATLLGTRLRAMPSYVGAATLNLPFVPRMVRETSKAAAHHPTDPHTYVQLVGVHPDAQGRGVGSALLRHVFDTSDAAAHPVYLETSNPRNIPLYERHGFRVVDSYDSRDITTWNLWRDPAPAAPAAAAAS